MTLKEFVISNVNPDEYYAKRYPKWNPRVRPLVTCPFHDDGAKPNLNVGLRNGGARCHSSQCRASLGNIVHFESRLQGIREGLAAKRLYREFYRKVIPKKTLLHFREELSTRPEYLLKIRRELGLSFKWVKRFQLGFDPDSKRITIPVYDQFNQCVNIRYYRLPSERTKSDDAKIYNHKGYGACDLFPSVEFDDVPEGAPVYIMAAETEAMLARADGLYAFSSTAGEGSWSNDWEQHFDGHPVFVVYDTDKGGQEATDRVVPDLKTRRDRVYPIVLPFRKRRPDYKDYKDFRLKGKQEAKELVKAAQKLDVRTKSPAGRNGVHGSVDGAVHHHAATDPERGALEFPVSPEPEEETMYDIASISSRSDLLNKKLRTQGIVASKASHTYSIPWKFRVKMKGRSTEYAFPIGRELLRFVRATDDQILQLLQNVFGTTSMSAEPLAYVTATEVEIIPTAVIDQDVPYVIQRCYYFGERIDSNVPYYIEVIPTAEIRTQETIGIITKVSPLSKSIERFDFSAANLADLSMFQPDEESVWDKLVSVGDALAEDHLRVYNRLDWVLSALLTWTSPIGWRFPNEPELQRGWLNTLGLGDTETGKSKAAKALKGLFNCGVFVNSENCTFVGLVGGAVKVGSGQLMLRWGRIPLNDKQLVVLEELSGLSIEEISHMSEVRSSGVARLDKGGISAETNSRTRLLCISNARGKGRSVNRALYGVYAVQDLIGHSEDIARFDIITTLTDREVSVDVINTDRTSSKKQTINRISSDQYQKLIQFIWALQPDQIEFDYDAYETCLSETKRLSSIYHPDIPIFKGGSGRYKLARIAASIACLQFSWDDDAKLLRIKAEHVRAASQLLETIYGKHSFGYHEWSKQMYEREHVRNGAILRKAFTEKVPKATLPEVIEALIHTTKFNRDELCALTGTTFLHADQLIGHMLRCHVINKFEANVWVLTPAGKGFLVKYLKALRKQ